MVLYLRGWRPHFYSTEGHKPVHIHAQRGDRGCKHWLDVEAYEILAAYPRSLSTRDSREVRKIILQHLGDIADAWGASFELRHSLAPAR
ncbi:DUF4160 domain-containing protein [Nodosilinea nodulosa]|uniref:DUF4160 domain-containing protein n=1 Tax=Nodosilinea nodulosa TaxID=416001 RepID=UPI001CEDC292|nr:DUF4160 domain-containing protein [Nodosilinea nodulosa]